MVRSLYGLTKPSCHIKINSNGTICRNQRQSRKDWENRHCSRDEIHIHKTIPTRDHRLLKLGPRCCDAYEILSPTDVTAKSLKPDLKRPREHTELRELYAWITNASYLLW